MNGKNRNNQKGQILIEAILIMVLSIGLLNMGVKLLKNEKVFNKLTNAVWSGVAQMAEFGDWPSASPPVHPNSSIRTRTLDPTK